MTKTFVMEHIHHVRNVQDDYRVVLDRMTETMHFLHDRGNLTSFIATRTEQWTSINAKTDISIQLLISV